MNYFKCATIIISGLIIGLPLSAAANDYEKRFPVAETQRIIIDQQHFRPVTVGVNFYPVTTMIRSYDGSELIVRADEKSTFGFRNPAEIAAETIDGELRINLGFKNSMTAGISIGSLRVEILIPADWNGDLELVELKSGTSIEDLDIRSVTAETSITGLSMSNCSFGNVSIELGADTDLTISGTDLGTCRIRGTMGKITGSNIEGNLDVETFDGDISLDFSGFSGKTSLVSKLGKIRAGLPEGAETEIDLSSRLGKVECEHSLTSSSVLGKSRIRGSIGAAGSDNSLILRSGDGNVLLVKAEQ